MREMSTFLWILTFVQVTIYFKVKIIHFFSTELIIFVHAGCWHGGWKSGKRLKNSFSLRTGVGIAIIGISFNKIKVLTKPKRCTDVYLYQTKSVLFHFEILTINHCKMLTLLNQQTTTRLFDVPLSNSSQRQNIVSLIISCHTDMKIVGFPKLFHRWNNLKNFE